MSKSKKNSKKSTPSRKVNTRRGSKVWSFKHFCHRILTGLLNDIVSLEKEGLEKKYCDEVSEFLQFAINSATGVQSSGFTGPIFLDIEKFATFYEEWNDIEGNSENQIEDRRKCLKKLRWQRQRITNKARRIHIEIENNLDGVILTSTYRLIGNLINIVPDIFKNLSSAFGDYIARGGLIG